MFFSHDTHYDDDDPEGYLRKIMETSRRAFTHTETTHTETEEDFKYFCYVFEHGGLEVDEADYHGIRTQLHNASYHNALRTAEYLLLKNANAFLPAERGYNALHVAAKRGHDQMVGMLLNNSSGERVKKFIDAKTTNHGYTALHLAAKNDRYVSVIFLLCFGANFEAKDNYGKMPIEKTTSGIVRGLLASAASISRTAIEGKKLSVQDLQLRLNSLSPNDYFATNMARNSQGYTPLQLAVYSNHLPTFTAFGQLRLSRLTPDFPLQGSLTLLDKKVEGLWNNLLGIHLNQLRMDNSSKEKVLKEGSYALLCSWKIVEAFEEYRKTLKDPYFTAPHINYIEEILEVFEFDPKHFDANYKDDSEEFVTKAQGTRYHQMLLSSHNSAERQSLIKLIELAILAPIVLLIKFISSSQLMAAVKENDLKTAKKCVNDSVLGVDMDIQDADGKRPLHIAADTGNYEMVEFLLTNKADMLTATEIDNETPLHIAVKEGHLHIVQLFLDNCDENKINDYVNAKIKSTGMTALHLALKNDRLDIACTLLAHHAIYCVKNNYEKSPIELSKSAEMKEFFQFIDEVFDDAKNGREKVIEKLKNLERDFLLAVGNACDIKGYSPAQVATLNKHGSIGTQIFKLVVEAKKVERDVEFVKVNEDLE